MARVLASRLGEVELRRFGSIFIPAPQDHGGLTGG
jgi:hypothetical protein